MVPLDQRPDCEKKFPDVTVIGVDTPGEGRDPWEHRGRVDGGGRTLPEKTTGAWADAKGSEETGEGLRTRRVVTSKRREKGRFEYSTL